MNRGTRLKFRQLLIIVITWMALGIIIAIYDHLVIHTTATLGPAENYSLAILIGRNVGGGLIGALLGGSFLVFFVNVKYPAKPYGYTIIAVIITFVLIMVFITMVMGAVIIPIQTGRPLSDPLTNEAFLEFIKDSYPIKNAIVWSFIVATTQLLLQVSSKFGQGTFWDIIRGKYNTPKVEKRIFMFVDINSSTTIAERLGDESYHELLHDFFADITEPIVNNKGNIYQYVGDEVVLAWNYQDGKENANCLKCFFDMKLKILKMKERYLEKYGLLPTFKAGIHCGKVVAGEIGIIKRDITYSGDVLNTTSRIQSMCKEFKVELIASSEVIKELSLAGKYITQPLGSITLRGKTNDIMLNSLQLAEGMP